MRKLLSVVIISMLMCFFFPAHTATAAQISNPKLMLTGYDLDESISSQGETKVYLNFTNMSENYDFSEIMITYTSPNNTVAPVFGATNQIYIDSLAAGETKLIELPIIIFENNNEYARVDFNMQYTYADSQMDSNYSYIVFLSQRDGNLTITNANVARTTMVGAQTIASVSYTNNSSVPVYNAKLILAGDIEEKVIFIGTVGAGETGYSENYFVFDEPGIKNLTISITYENAEGVEKIEQGALYSVQVDEVEATDVPQETVDENMTQQEVRSVHADYIILVLITLLVLVILLGVVFGRKKR